MVTLGQKIRQRRLEKKLTQTQLSEGLVSASAISQIESDKINPSYKLLCKIAERLEVPLDYFLSEEEEYLEKTTSHKLAKTFVLAKEYTQALPILEKLYRSSMADNTELMLDLAICHIHLHHHKDAYELLDQVMQHSLRDDDKITYVTSLHKMGLLYYKQNNLSLAIHYWRKAYDFFPELDTFNPFLKAEVATNLAIACNRVGQYDRSAQLFAESQELIQGSSNLLLLATNYMGLGASYYGNKDFKTAEEYCQEAITLFKSLDQIRSSITVKENFAIMTGESGDTEKALTLLFECLQEYVDQNLLSYTSNTHAEIAKLLINQSKFDEATHHIEAAFRTCEPNTPNHAQSYFVRSLLKVAQQLPQVAISDTEQAMGIFLKADLIQGFHNASLHLCEIYKSLGDYKTATQVLEEAQKSLQIYLKERGVI